VGTNENIDFEVLRILRALASEVRMMLRDNEMASNVANNGWSLFVRLVEPDKHYKAIVSRPLLLHGIGKQTRHAAQ
jgi:hypothetical protein